MYRLMNNHFCIIVCAIVCALGVSASVAAQDRTADWLEANQLDGLLALHLERERDAAAGDGEQRVRLGVRLATVYTRILSTEKNPEERSRIMEAALRLLDSPGMQEADALRLALLRARYTTASSIMENGRAALESEEATLQAARELKELALSLEQVRIRIGQEIKRKNSALDRARGLRARGLEERITSLRQSNLAASLLEGWTLYYLGREGDDRRLLREAEARFGFVLQGDNPIPAPEEVSEDRQEFEFYSSAVLGMAMTVSMLEGYVLAKPWFDRLENPVTWGPIRTSLPGWRMAAALDADDVKSALRLLDDLATRSDIPASWLRIAAVKGLGTTGVVSRTPRSLASKALSILAANGELAQAVDLAERFGVEAMGEEGFAFRYVRGVQEYREATTAQEDGRMADAKKGFANAVDELLAAAEESDAETFGVAVPGCLSLAGWSLLELARYEEAANTFQAAAEKSQGPRRADAEWGAIVALDQMLALNKDNTTIRERRNTFIELFLDRFPADERSPTLLVRRITGDKEPSAEDIVALRKVPVGHESWENARRQAARALYRRFRTGELSNRSDDGRAFLEVAEELLSRNRNTDDLFASSNSIDGVLLRQGVEVAVHPNIADIDRGNRWLAMLEMAWERGAFLDQPDIINEIAYRQVSLAIAMGTIARAVTELELMPIDPSTEEANHWTLVAARRVHSLAYARLREDGGNSENIDAVIVAGEMLLNGESDDLSVVVQREALLPIAASVATAHQLKYFSGGDLSEGRRALAIHLAILEVRPRDGSVLEAAAKTSLKLGELEISLGLWRTLSSGAPRGSEQWWEARTNLLEILAQTDTQHARTVLGQHLQLYPQYGPSPWGDRIRQVETNLEIAQFQSDQSGGGV